MNRSEEKWEKPHFKPFKRIEGDLKGIKIIPNNLKNANV